MPSARKLRFLLRKLLRTLGRATGTAHQIAMGVAIGFFVGWLPIIGTQMAVAVVVCTIFRANKVVPIFPIWLTNPVTMVPIYSFNYWVGWLIVGGPPLSDLAAILRKMITPPDPTPDMGRMAAWWQGIRHAFTELLSMGWEMQVPLWLGCVIVGLALAIPSYYLSRKFVVAFREAVAKKRQLRQEMRRRASGMDVNLGGTYNNPNWMASGTTRIMDMPVGSASAFPKVAPAVSGDEVAMERPPAPESGVEPDSPPAVMTERATPEPVPEPSPAPEPETKTAAPESDSGGKQAPATAAPLSESGTGPETPALGDEPEQG